MDIFSAGCVIAEVMTDGSPIFDLERLRQYSNKKLDPLEILDKKIQDKNVIKIILKMIAVNPKKRPTISECLEYWNKEVFPTSFSSVFF